MLFSEDQLHHLTSAGLYIPVMEQRTETDEMLDIARPPFVPNRLNDDRRVDLTKAPFFAFDCNMPEEIDDAVRVVSLPSGFLKQIAIVDVGQIPLSDPLLANPHTLRNSQYRRNQSRSKRMMPEDITARLELSAGKYKRAIVVSQTLDAQAQPTGEMEVFPATVRVQQRNMRQLGKAFNQRGTELSPIIGLLRHGSSGDAFRRGIPKSIHRQWALGSRAVSVFMIDLNTSLSEWAQEKEIPVIRRSVSKGQTVGGRYYVGEAPEDGHYMHASSPLRRKVDLFNMLNIAHYLQDPSAPAPFDAAALNAVIGNKVDSAPAI